MLRGEFLKRAERSSIMVSRSRRRGTGIQSEAGVIFFLFVLFQHPSFMFPKLASPEGPLRRADKSAGRPGVMTRKIYSSSPPVRTRPSVSGWLTVDFVVRRSG